MREAGSEAYASHPALACSILLCYDGMARHIFCTFLFWLLRLRYYAMYAHI
jgi:hypothetical protein